MPCDRPLDLCPNCVRPRRGARCVCGHVFAAPPVLGMDDYTRRIGLDGVRKARKTLRIAKALRQLDTAEVA